MQLFTPHFPFTTSYSTFILPIRIKDGSTLAAAVGTSALAVPAVADNLVRDLTTLQDFAKTVPVDPNSTVSACWVVDIIANAVGVCNLTAITCASTPEGYVKAKGGRHRLLETCVLYFVPSSVAAETLPHGVRVWLIPFCLGTMLLPALISTKTVLART